MSRPTYITSGDQQFNPDTGRWGPISSPIPAYVPSAGDPIGGSGAVLTPGLSDQARAELMAELQRQGLPLPPELAGGQQASQTGDAQQGEGPHVIEGGASLDELGREVLDAQGDELEGVPAVDRLSELERRPAHDTDRPPPRKGRRG